jgi:hypothetical protein
MNKITFKKHPRESGSWSIGHPNSDVDIKLDGKIIGIITGPAWNTPDFWIVSIQVYKNDIMEDENPNCKWKWVRFTKGFETENEAREYTKENIHAVLEKYKLYYTD